MTEQTLETRVHLSSSILKKLRSWTWIISIIAFIIQSLFFRSIENVVCSINVLAIWFYASKYLLNSINLIRFPISIFLILSFTLTQFYLPLLFTTIEFKPLIYNLKYPIEVFIHSDLAFLILIITHFLYRFWLAKYKVIVQNKIQIFQFYVIPTKSEIWIMGYMGIIASFFGRFSNGDAGTIQKFLQGSMYLAYVPYLIPCSSLFGSKEVINKRDYLKLAILTILILLISIGANTRGGVILGVVSVGLVYGLGVLLGEFKNNIFSKKTIAIGIFSIYLFSGPLADLGTAMLLVRSQRGDVSKEKLISETFKYYFDKTSIQKFNSSTRVLLGAGEWDENYLDNIFLARFCNLKFNDLSLEQAYLIGNKKQAYYEYSINKIFTTLPEPILNFMGVNIDKIGINKKSFGDVLYKMAGAGDEVLGGFRGGHFAGTGLAAFGWWYLLILGITMLPIYFLYDVFVINKKTLIQGKIQEQYYLSICILANILSVFQFLPSESIISNVSFLIRGWIQLLFLFAVYYYIAKRLSKILPF